MTQSDLIIIGAGPGGYRAAELAARQGLKVTIFEEGHVGGTCLNVGCIPTKTFVHSSTFSEAVERQQQVVGQLRAGVEQLLSHPGITLVRQRATFVDAHTVAHHPSSAEETGAGSFSAPNIIIATGSSPKLLPIVDATAVDSNLCEGTGRGPRVVTSTGMLQLTEQPRRLCIIGAGVIGMEFASVFQRFGTEVTVIEYLKECLPMVDADVAKRLRKLLEKRGISFHMKTAVESLDDIDADVILMATGRKPNVQDDFANAGFAYDDRRGITVDDHFQTTVPGIYAIGDVNGRQMLAHAAEMQARIVVDSILGHPLPPAPAGGYPMPAAIFTQPEAACVGPTEEMLKQEGTPYECRKAFWRANGKALAMGETEGMLKLFSEPDGGRILGCHAFGAHAADLIQEASVLMCCQATVRQLRYMVHIHPTLSEILQAAAE